MGVLKCNNCDKPLSEYIISFGNTYVRLCKKCYSEYADKRVFELLENNEEEIMVMIQKKLDGGE